MLIKSLMPHQEWVEVLCDSVMRQSVRRLIIAAGGRFIHDPDDVVASVGFRVPADP